MIQFYRLAPILLATAASAGLLDSLQGDDWWQCPDPMEFVDMNPQYPIECVDNSIPPWPLCLFHDIEYFVNASVSSAGRCCDFNNLTECKCPYKGYSFWEEKMTPWCASIATCPGYNQTSSSSLVTDFWATFIED